MKIESFSCPCCGAPAKIGIGNCEYCGAFNTLLTDDERTNINNSLQANIKKISKNSSEKEYENERTKKILESNLGIKEKLDLMNRNFSKYAINLWNLDNTFGIKNGELKNPDFANDANTFINDTYKYTLDEIRNIVTKAIDGGYGPLYEELRDTVYDCKDFLKTFDLYIPLIKLTKYDSKQYQALEAEKTDELKALVVDYIDFMTDGEGDEHSKKTMEKFFHEYYFDYDYKCITHCEDDVKEAIDAIDDKISELNHEIARLGMFQMAKKKELKEQKKELEIQSHNMEIDLKISKKKKYIAENELELQEIERDEKPLAMAIKKKLSETAFTAFKEKSKLKKEYDSAKFKYENRENNAKLRIKETNKEIAKLQKELM